MNDRMRNLEERLAQAERSVRHLRVAFLGLAALALIACATEKAMVPGAGGSTPRVEDSLVVRRLTIVDAKNRPRIVLGSDPEGTQRRSPMTGMQVLDESGAERFGLGVGLDNAVRMGFDAPHGVGAPMPDRIGIGVEPDGSAFMMLIDNKTLVPVALRADAQGGGGLEFVGYDFERKEATVLRSNFEGQRRTTVPLGGG